MSHRRRNGKLRRWRSKRANHGRMGGVGFEKGLFRRAFRRKDKTFLKAHDPASPPPTPAMVQAQQAAEA